MAALVITIKGAETHKLKGDATAPHEALRHIRAYLLALSSGNEKGRVFAQASAADAVAASVTATLVSCATDTITIGGVVFTGSGSPSGELQFSTAGTDTQDAAALAAAINAHSTLRFAVVASNVAGVVTIRSRVRGVIGNFIAVSETGTTITLSSATLLGGTGGAIDAEANYNFGE